MSKVNNNGKDRKTGRVVECCVIVRNSTFKLIRVRVTLNYKVILDVNLTNIVELFNYNKKLLSKFKWKEKQNSGKIIKSTRRLHFS